MPGLQFVSNDYRARSHRRPKTNSHKLSRLARSGCLLSDPASFQVLTLELSALQAPFSLWPLVSPIQKLHATPPYFNILKERSPDNDLKFS